MSLVPATALTLPPSPALNYLRTHARSLRALADSLRLFTLFSPSSTTDLLSESLSSLLSLLTLALDTLSSPQPLPLPPLAALSALRALSLPLEILSIRTRRHHPTITLLESAKAALRLNLLSLRSGSPSTPAVEAPPHVPDPPACTCGLRDVPGASRVAVARGPRSGRKILAIAPAGSLEPLFATAYERRAAWLMRAFSPGACPACDAEDGQEEGEGEGEVVVEVRLAAPRRASRTEVAAEVLFILRPVVQLLLVRAYGWRSWRAWGGALGMDVVSRQMMARGGEEAEEERRRRALLMLLYLARNPFFDTVVRAAVERVERGLSRVPVIGRAAGGVAELMRGVERYWFYTAGS